MLLKTSANYDIKVQGIASAYDQNWSVKTGATSNYTEIAEHVSLDGLGIPQVDRRFLPFPSDDGGIDTGFHLRPRSMVWKLFVYAETESAYLTAIDQLFTVFRPYDRAMILTVTTPAGATRKLDVYVNGPVDVDQSNQVGYSALVSVPLYAPNPLWYGASTTTETITPSTSPTSKSIVYGGTWAAWPVIRFVGELVDPKLRWRVNTAAGLRYYYIDFTGHTIASGRTYTVDLNPGVKTILDDLGTDRLGNLAEFGTLPQLQVFSTPIDAPSGQNNADLYFTSFAGAGKVEIDYVPRYIAI